MLGPEVCKAAGERPHSVSLGPIDAERYRDCEVVSKRQITSKDKARVAEKA
jgi:hypothetical protein